MSAARRVVPVLIATAAALGGCKDKSARDEAATDPTERAATAPETAAKVSEPPPTPRAELPSDDGEHSGAHSWSRHFGSGEPDAARALARDGSGALYLAGYFKGAQPFSKKEGSADHSDGFLTKLSAKGEVEWTVTLGGPGPDTGDAVAVDAEGNAYVAGSFGDELTVRDGVLDSAGADDAYVGKFDPAGRRLWVKRFGGVDIDAAHAIAVDGDGNLYVTGVFRQDVQFGDETLTSAGSADIFLMKITSAGELAWTRQFGAIGADYGRALAIDSRGDIVFLGEFSRGVDFGGGELGSNGNRDVVLAKFSPDGAHRWSTSFGNNMDELAIGMSLDPADNAIITGSFDEKLQLGDGVHQAAGRSDVFIAKFTPTGKPLWSRSFGGEDEDIGAAVATDSFGNIYATGWFWFTVDFGGGELESAGKKDIFLVKMSPAGEHLWSRRFGGKEVDFGKGLVATDAGVTLTGTFHYQVDFGGGALGRATDEAQLPKGDLFVASFGR